MLGKRGTYQRKTETELTQLASDIADLKVFTSNHVAFEDRDLLDHIFIPLFLMGEREKGELVEDGIDLLYQYTKEAGPKVIKGYPTFDHVCSLNVEDTAKLMELYRKLLAEREQLDPPP